MPRSLKVSLFLHFFSHKNITIVIFSSIVIFINVNFNYNIIITSKTITKILFSKVFGISANSQRLELYTQCAHNCRIQIDVKICI